MALHSSSTALQDLGCYVNDDWEVRRFDDPHERVRWDNALEYDQLVRLFHSCSSILLLSRRARPGRFVRSETLTNSLLVHWIGRWCDRMDSRLHGGALWIGRSVAACC